MTIFMSITVANKKAIPEFLLESFIYYPIQFKKELA